MVLLVAGDEGDLDRWRLVVASLTGAVGADTVSVGAPLARPTALAGNSHLEDRNETKRNCPPEGNSL